MGRKDSLPEDAPAPRLCELVKWPHFQGYGFNLHSEKGKDGQFIGKIDPQSPAEACGLQEGDQIIEVNGVNTSNENHKQVVERIKTHVDHASLLVVDPKAAEYYKKRNIVVKGTMANVKQLKASSSDGPTHDKETGESETSSQTHLSIEDSLTLAAQGDGGDEPPPVPPKTELASEEQKPTEPENAEVPPPVEGAPASETKTEEPAAKPVDDKLAVEKPAEEKPAGVTEGEKPTEKTEEEKPAEKKSEEEKAEEKKATEKNSEEETPTEKKPEEERAEEKAPEAPPSEGTPEAKPTEKAPVKEANSSKDASPAIDTSLQVESGSDRTQPSPAPSASSTGTVESAKSAESGSTAAEGDKFGLKLNMTAAEMREYLKGKKRHDPRNDNLSFKRRHEIVQNM